MSKTGAWIEAMRLRTLPVSVAGVIAGVGLSLLAGIFRPVPAILCLGVAVLAQIASNFANEYYDYKAGIDRPGREGPRRGVTEGDLTPGAMLRATYLTLAAACLVGCGLIYYGGWWMIAVGVAVAVGAVAYSAGPYPLSHHGLGELAVVIFFGIVPVGFTFYLQSGAWPSWVTAIALAMGLAVANVLIVNNYRDFDDDRRVGKQTLAQFIGRRNYRNLYLVNSLCAVMLCYSLRGFAPSAMAAIPAAYLTVSLLIWAALGRREGRSLTPLLGMTAVTILISATGFAIWAALA